MSAEAAAKRRSAAKAAKSERKAAKSMRKAAKAERKAAKTTKSGRSAKSGGSAKSAKSGRSTRSAASTKSRRIQRSAKSSRSSKSQRSGRSQRMPVDGVRLIHARGEVIVKEADLVEVSALMKQRQQENRLAKAVSLKDFSPECVQLLATYISKRTIRASVSFFTIAEVLKLTKAFMIEALHKRMEEVLLDAAMKSPANLLQALLVNDVSTVSRDCEVQLHYLAAWKFLELVRVPDFHKLPPNQFLKIFPSCDLNVPHELVAADAALLWLAGQPDLDILGPAVFSLIRSTYLGKPERLMLVERCHILNFPGPVIRVLKVVLDSRHNNRLCLSPEHIAKHLPRCGVADPKRRPAELALPLSRPRQGLIRPKQTKSKTKTDRSGRSTRSATTSKSTRSKMGGSRKSTKSSGRSQRSAKSKKSSRTAKKRPVGAAA